MTDHAPKPPKVKLSKTDLRRDSESLRRERSIQDASPEGDTPDALDEILFDSAPPESDSEAKENGDSHSRIRKSRK